MADGCVCLQYRSCRGFITSSFRRKSSPGLDIMTSAVHG